MWSHNKNEKRVRNEKGQADLLSSLTQSAILAHAAASEEYLEWLKRHASEHFHRKIHGHEFCLHNLEVMPHPAMQVGHMKLTTKGEIDPNGMIVPAASNEEEYPTVEIEITLRVKDKSQALHKMGAEINKINMDQRPSEG